MSRSSIRMRTWIIRFAVGVAAIALLGASTVWALTGSVRQSAGAESAQQAAEPSPGVVTPKPGPPTGTGEPTILDPATLPLAPTPSGTPIVVPIGVPDPAALERAKGGNSGEVGPARTPSVGGAPPPDTALTAAGQQSPTGAPTPSPSSTKPPTLPVAPNQQPVPAPASSSATSGAPVRVDPATLPLAPTPSGTPIAVPIGVPDPAAFEKAKSDAARGSGAGP